MNTQKTDALVYLTDTDKTVADPEENIQGRDVKDRAGNDIGTVKNLLVDQDERKVRFLEIASGGFLGIGQDITLIPVDAISGITPEEVRIDQTRDHISAAPAYDPELIQERDGYGGLLGYYGYGPFWAPGYRYPDYPRYRDPR